MSRDGTEPGISVLRRLAEQLENLESDDLELALTELSTLLQRTRRKREAAGNGYTYLRPGGHPLVRDWAEDGGMQDSRQWLAVDVKPGPTKVLKTRSATGRSIASNGFLGADILHLPAGDGFDPHTHPGDHLLFVLAGKGTVAVDGEIIPTRAGQAYLVEGAVPHAVGAITDHVILAIGAPHRPLDSIERQELVEYSALMTPMGDITCTICQTSATSQDELTATGCPHSPGAAR